MKSEGTSGTPSDVQSTILPTSISAALSHLPKGLLSWNPASKGIQSPNKELPSSRPLRSEVSPLLENQHGLSGPVWQEATLLTGAFVSWRWCGSLGGKRQYAYYRLSASEARTPQNFPTPFSNPNSLLRP